jgi:CHASE1-domain containing sensor protein
MNSLIIKTAAIAIAVVVSGLSVSAIVSHQIKVKNEKEFAEIDELTNKMRSRINELDAANQGNPDYPR